MNIIKGFSTLIAFTLLMASCVKEVDCENAEMCVRNVGTDTVFYCWNCSDFSSIILPGEKACKNVGKIYISSTKESTVGASFNSPQGNYITEIRDCYTEFEIE